MTLYDKIMAIYPELSGDDFASGTIELRNEGHGDYIASWEHPTLEQPTEAQLNSVEN